MTISFEIQMKKAEKTTGAPPSRSEKPKIICDGEYTTRATWENLSLFTSVPGMNQKKLCAMIQTYEQEAYKKDPNSKRGSVAPGKCWLQDESLTKNGSSPPMRLFEQFQWKPARIKVEPYKVRVVSNDSEIIDQSSNPSLSPKLCHRSSNRGAALEKALSKCVPEIICKVTEGDSLNIRKHNIKAKVTYKLSLIGTVAANFEDVKNRNPFWNCKLEYILRLNKMRSVIYVTEEVDLECFATA